MIPQVSIIRRLRGSTVGVAGKLWLGTVSQANTFAFVDQYDKVLPCTALAFARHYSLGT